MQILKNIYVPVLDRRELSQYRVVDAILACMPGVGADQDTGLARRASDAAIVRTSRPCMGQIRLPREVLFGYPGDNARTMLATGNPSAGGYTVASGIRPLYDYTFGASAVLQLGATFVGGLDEGGAGVTRGSMSVPTISGAAEAEWVSEGAAPTANSDPEFGQVIATPKRCVASVNVSKQLLAQDETSAEIQIRRHIGGAIAAALDAGAEAGIGGKEPQGLLFKEGVNQVSLGNDGGALTRAKLNAAEAAVAAGRHNLSGAGYILSLNTREKAKNIQVATGASAFLVETENGFDRCNGYPAVQSHRLPDDTVKGSGTGLGSLIFGLFRHLEIFTWGGADILVDPVTRARWGEVVVTVDLLADVVTPRPDAFAVIRDVLNT